jgi:hypothetical protein
VDSEDLVRLWHNRVKDRSVIKQVLDEISELSLFFTGFSLSHARREANQAAHSCAKYASYMMGCFPGMLSHLHF